MKDKDKLLDEKQDDNIDKTELESSEEWLEELEEEEDSGNIATLPMIPLRGLTIFPNMVLHFDIGREKSINALEKAMILNKHIFLVTQKDESTDLPTSKDFYHVGTVAKIKQMLKLPGDNIRVLVEGLQRGNQGYSF